MNEPRLSNFDVKGPDVLAEVRTAMLELEDKIRSGETASCESIFAAFPQVLEDKEAVLEVIYTEFVLRQELGQEVSTKEWIGRFPQWNRDLEELFQVHDLVSQDAPLGEPTKSQAGLESWIEGRDTLEARPRIGNYEIIKELGRGSMGTVFLARHRTLGREVAIKTVNERDAGTPQVLERFRIEAEASAKLQHPNIVQIFEVGLHNRLPFFAMEYVAGGNLAQAIHFRPINARNAARLTEALARAIHSAHLQGIVHRDLKPANILLSPSDRPIAVTLELPKEIAQEKPLVNGFEPKVTDFGLAKRLDLESLQTLPGNAIGTPSYMAPEQTGDSSLTAGPASDIYSLGAVLYDMLVGRPPFLAPTVAETLNKVLNEEPISLCSLQAHVPRDLETICLKCLQKDPAKRYRTANDLADDVQRFLLGKPILARPAGPVERAIKSMRRHPLFTVFLMTLTLGVIAFASQWWRAEMHRTTAERETLKAIAAREDEFAERHRLERVLYAHDISLAKLEFLSNRTTRSKELLNKWSSEQTHWEWSYLHRTCQQELCDFDEFKLPGWSVAISPDGKLVAAATAIWGVDHESEIKVWRIDSKELQCTLRGHSSSIMDVEFSPDGKFLASIGAQWKANTPLGGLNVWDVQSGTAIWSDDETSGHCVTFSPSGKEVAATNIHTIALYDTATGKPLGRFTGHKNAVHEIAFRPDGEYILSASRDGSARLWNVESRQQTSVIDGLSDARRISFSPSGTECVVGLYNGVVIICRQEGEALIESIRFAEPSLIGGLRYAPDGKTIAISSLNRSIKLVDSKSLKVMQQLYGHNGNTLDIAFDHEGIRMASTGQDGHVRVWDLSQLENPDQAIRHEIPGPHFSAAAFLSSNNSQVVVALSENTNRAGVANDFSAKIYDLNSRAFVKAFIGHTDWLSCHALDPRDRWVATGSRDKTVRIFNRQTGELRHQPKDHSARLLAMSSLDDGDRLVTVAEDQTMRVWDTETGAMKTQWTLASRPISVAAQSGSKLIATAIEGGAIQLWREDSPIAVANVPSGAGEVVRLAFSPNGDTLAASKSNGTIELRDLSKMQSVSIEQQEVILSGHTESVSSITFSPDGQRLASCSSDRTIRIWDVNSKEEVLSLTAETGSHPQVLFSPNGRRLLCINQNKISEWVASEETDIRTADKEERRVRWHFSEYLSSVFENHPFATVQHISSILDSEHVKADRLNMLHARARALIELGKFDQAVIDYESIPTASRKVSLNNLGLYYLLAGNTEGYHRVCVEMSKDVSTTLQINNATWLCLLHPETISRYPSLQESATKTLDGNDANSLNTLGSMYARTGEFKKAIEILEKGIVVRGKPYPLDWFFLSLAHRGLEQNENATKYSMKLHAWLKEQELKRALGHPTDSTFSKTLELELKLFLAEDQTFAGSY